MKTDTLEQIIDHALTKGVTIGRITTDEIIAIAIKSPEAREYCKLNDNTPILIMEARAEERQQCIDAVALALIGEPKLAIQAIEALKEVQSE